MGAALFIVLDNRNPGFDPFVNGKAVARDSKCLARIARSLGLQEFDEFVSQDTEEARATLEAIGGGVPGDIPPLEEQWFDPGEGIDLITKVAEYIKTNRKSVKNVDGVLSDLAEYCEVLAKAKSIGAKWHFAIDY